MQALTNKHDANSRSPHTTTSRSSRTRCLLCLSFPVLLVVHCHPQNMHMLHPERVDDHLCLPPKSVHRYPRPHPFVCFITPVLRKYPPANRWIRSWSVVDIAADSALCFFPLRMFWQLTESRSKYRVLLILFSASVLTAVTSIFHAYVNNHLRIIRTSSKDFQMNYSIPAGLFSVPPEVSRVSCRTWRCFIILYISPVT